MSPSCSEQRLDKDPTLPCCWLFWVTDVNVFKDKYSSPKLSPACFHSYKPIVDYIDTQFENYLQEELKIKRSLFNYHDTRIHICLYFISPTGHSLKSLDLVTMKKLDSKVHSAIPVCISHLRIPHPPPHPPPSPGLGFSACQLKGVKECCRPRGGSRFSGIEFPETFTIHNILL